MNNILFLIFVFCIYFIRQGSAKSLKINEF